jgi:hypothetical protein
MLHPAALLPTLLLLVLPLPLLPLCRSCLASLEKRKMQPELLLSTRVSTRRTKRQQVLLQHQHQQRSPLKSNVELRQPAADVSCAQLGSCASLQQLCWPQTTPAAAAGAATMPGSASMSSISLAAFDPCAPTASHGGGYAAAACWEPSAIAAPAPAAAGGAFTAHDCSCILPVLTSAASASESSLTAAAAASLADAWWQSEQQQQQQQQGMAQPGGAFAPSSPAGTGTTGLAAAAAAASSCDDESVLDSLLVEAINQSLAGTCSNTAAPHSSTTSMAVAAAPAAAAGEDLEATDEELELMIMQEMAAAGIAISAAGGIVMPAPANHPAASALAQQMPSGWHAQHGQLQQHAPCQQLLQYSNAAALSSWPGMNMPPAAAAGVATAGATTAGAGSTGRVGILVDTLQQQTLEVERMLFELKQLRDAPPRPSVPAAAGDGVMHSSMCYSAMTGSVMTVVSGWYGCC